MILRYKVEYKLRNTVKYKTVLCSDCKLVVCAGAAEGGEVLAVGGVHGGEGHQPGRVIGTTDTTNQPTLT